MMSGASKTNHGKSISKRTKGGVRPVPAFSLLIFRGGRISCQPQSRLWALTVLPFYIGVLTPEECIYSIEQILEDAEKKNKAYNSVLLSDTAELCTGFPLLSKDPVFIAALPDLFESMGLVTVGIGVEATDLPSLRAINLTLMARASHRLVLRHFPNVERLMSDKIQPKPDVKSKEEFTGANALELNEQLVSVVIDNVTGKTLSTPTQVGLGKGGCRRIAQGVVFLRF